MKKTVKQTLAFLLAAMMLFALCACGETNVEETAAPEFVYKADYQKLAPMENGANFYPRYASEDGFYALIDVKVGERELEEGEILEYQGQLDVYESRLFHMDFDGNITELKDYRPYEPEKAEKHDIYAYSRVLVMKEGGGFLELIAVSDSWFDEESYARAKGLSLPVTEIVYDDYYFECWHYENAYLLRTLDDKGAAQSSVKLDVTAVVEAAGYDYIDLYSMAQADEGHVLTSGDGGLFLFDITSGAMTGRIDGFEYCDSLLRLNDGRIVASFYGDSGQKLALVDLEGMTKGKEFDAQGELYLTDVVKFARGRGLNAEAVTATRDALRTYYDEALAEQIGTTRRTMSTISRAARLSVYGPKYCVSARCLSRVYLMAGKRSPIVSAMNG